VVAAAVAAAEAVVVAPAVPVDKVVKEHLGAVQVDRAPVKDKLEDRERAQVRLIAGLVVEEEHWLCHLPVEISPAGLSRLVVVRT